MNSNKCNNNLLLNDIRSKCENCKEWENLALVDICKLVSVGCEQSINWRLTWCFSACNVHVASLLSSKDYRYFPTEFIKWYLHLINGHATLPYFTEKSFIDILFNNFKEWVSQAYLYFNFKEQWNLTSDMNSLKFLLPTKHSPML